MSLYENEMKYVEVVSYKLLYLQKFVKVLLVIIYYYMKIHFPPFQPQAPSDVRRPVYLYYYLLYSSLILAMRCTYTVTVATAISIESDQLLMQLFAMCLVAGL